MGGGATGETKVMVTRGTVCIHAYATSLALLLLTTTTITTTPLELETLMTTRPRTPPQPRVLRHVRLYSQSNESVAFLFIQQKRTSGGEGKGEAAVEGGAARGVGGGTKNASPTGITGEVAIDTWHGS